MRHIKPNEPSRGVLTNSIIGQNKIEGQRLQANKKSVFESLSQGTTLVFDTPPKAKVGTKAGTKAMLQPFQEEELRQMKQENYSGDEDYIIAAETPIRPKKRKTQ